MLIVSLIAVQVLLFVGLIYTFRRIMTRNVVSATRHLEEMNEEYGKKEREADRRLAEARQKSDEILSKSLKEAESGKARIIKETEVEKDNILGQAHSQGEQIIQQADKSRRLLISEMDRRIEKEAIDKACELMQDILPDQFKRDVHSHWVSELIQSGFTELKRLRVPEDLKEARITSAFRLSEKERGDISRKLKEFLGRELTLREQIDAQLVAGVTVTIGSLVLDGSFKNKVREKAASRGMKE